MQTVTSSDGTRIAFDQLGEGEPLVLVAGASCDRGADATLAAALAEHFTVLNHDRRGRGDSTDTAPYAAQREIDDLAVLLDAAGGAAGLVGLSSGAALAVLAAAAGLPVRWLALWEPPYRLDAAGQRDSRAYAVRLRGLLDEDRNGDALELFMTFVGVPPPMIAGMRQSPYWAAGERLAPTLAHDAEVMGDSSLPEAMLETVAAPTLVLSGSASPAWMRETAAAVAEAVPRGRHRVLPDQTHDVDANLLATTVHEFADGLRREAVGEEER